MPKLAIFRPAPLRKRLWQAGVALLVLVLTFAVGNAFINKDKAVTSNMLGHDFMAFYSAGTFTRQGQFNSLYDLDAVRDQEQGIAKRNGLEIGSSFGPYWNPPFYAWFLAPFTTMPYRAALETWTVMNVGCLLIAMGLLVAMLPENFRKDWKVAALVPLLMFVSMPFLQALSHGQNTFMSLLLLTLVVTAWRKRWPIVAGIFCGCLFYKPQLAAVVAGMLILSMGWRVCVGLGAMGVSLLLLTVLTMPGIIESYPHQLSLNLQYMQIDRPYLWERHVTLKAFWRLLFQGRGPGETSGVVNSLTMLSIALIGCGLLTSFLRTRRCGIDDCWTGETRTIARDRLIVATIVSMPLLMPFYFDYDLLLLSIAAVLTAGEILALPPGQKLDRWQRPLVGSWIALFAWLMVNPSIAAASCVNVSVILLSTVSSLSIVRACSHGLRTSTMTVQERQQVTVKRAA